MKTRHRICAGLVIFTIIGQGVAQAQETANYPSIMNLVAAADPSTVLPLSGTNMTSLHNWSDDQLTVLVGALNEVPTIPASSLPRGGIGGTYWSMNQPGVPYPADTAGVDLWPMADGSFLMNDLNVDYTALSASPMGMGAMDSGFNGPPGFGDDGGPYSPDLTNTIWAPNYGSNLWISIAQNAVAAGNMSGVISNTTADVQMELQYTFVLTQPWQSANPNWFVNGSELTNWTVWSEHALSSTHLFLRVRSWATEDGSGLPTWWEEQYLNTNVVNGDALDSAGDGWTINEKFAMGLNPNAWVAPAVPQGFMVQYNTSANTTTLTWQPSQGNINGYTIQKTDSYNYPPSVTTITLHGTNATYTDSLSGDTEDPYNGNNYDVSYQVSANYSNGDSSAWTAQVPVQQITVSGAISPGPSGSTYLAVSGVPANAVSVRLLFIDSDTEYFYDDSSFNYDENIPVSSFTQGLYQLPAAWYPPATDAYGPANFRMYVASVDEHGNQSAANFFDGEAGWPTAAYNWGIPFYDCRVQLKQNLLFQLRSAPVDGSLQFQYGATYLYPTNYAVSSLYQYANQGVYPGTFDAFSPFEENYLFENFVYAATNVDNDGNLTTGVSSGNGTPYWDVANPTFLFNSGVTPYQAWLPTNSTAWLFYDQLNSGDDIQTEGIIGTSVNNQSEITITMPNNTYNWFGLRYVSVGVAGTSYSTGSKVNDVISAGHASTSWDFSNPYNIYVQAAQPQFETKEYDFWTAENYQFAVPPLPGDPSFSPTNGSQLLLTTVGNESYLVAGYAKMAVANSVYTVGQNNVFAYLGQYFTNAYTMTNGVATSTNTGVLSPYGNFMATEPGATALVTMADPDTGARGTGVVYVVSLQLDANHDGNMDLSFNGSDTTTTNSPYVFWANNNYDRWNYDVLSSAEEQDDILPGGSDAQNLDPNEPDCNYKINGYRHIPDTRDLEDFARLWVCGVTSNLLAALPAGSTVTLDWGDVGGPNANNPTIDLFQSADTNGGIAYLTNETVATAQIDPYQASYVGRLGPGQSIQLNGNYFGSTWRGDHFIWCGVSNGTGGLNLTIKDGVGSVLAQSTSYIQIVDIKQMYERWSVGENPSQSPSSTAYLATGEMPTFTPAYQFTQAITTNTPYILLVHGYNMQVWAKNSFAETAFKRLYWQGYQGRFGSFHWPTAQNAVQFGGSESQAWNSGPGLLSLLNHLNTVYPGKVYLAAHSLGNVVAGEALRLSGSNEVVNIYVAMQGAVAAHTYDPNTTPFSLAGYYDGAPDCYAHYWTNGAPCYFNGLAGAGSYVNFFNTNDWALANAWLVYQDAKPTLSPTYSYENGLYYKNNGFTELFFPGDRYELFANLIQAPCYALGMQPNVGGAFKTLTYHQIELDIPPYNFSTQHIYHSGEFRSDNPQRWQFWDELLFQMGLKSTL